MLRGCDQSAYLKTPFQDLEACREKLMRMCSKESLCHGVSLNPKFRWQLYKKVSQIVSEPDTGQHVSNMFFSTIKIPFHNLRASVFASANLWYVKVLDREELREEGVVSSHSLANALQNRVRGTEGLRWTPQVLVFCAYLLVAAGRND